jgi:hypothetical protein
MDVPMHHQPAIAFWIAGGAIKRKRLIRQSLQQLRP